MERRTYIGIEPGDGHGSYLLAALDENLGILALSRGSLDAALAYLEECVCARRIAWMDRHAESIEQTGNSLVDGFNLFYTHYLGLSLPRDGELVEANESCIRVRWSNRCPTSARRTR